MSDKLLQPPEIVERCADFKERWYAIAREIDAIAEFTSGRGDALLRKFLEIAEEAGRLGGELQLVTLSAKRYRPELVDELDARAEVIEEGLGRLRGRAEEEAENLRKFNRVAEETSSYREEIGKIEAELKEVESKVATLCTKFFERKKELKLARDKIKARVEKGIYDLQEKFQDKLSGILKDYELYLGEEKTSPSALFERMLKDPGAVEMVRLRPVRQSTGFFGIRLKREEFGEEARLEVLRFIAQELLEEARRLKEAELERARSLSREFADLDALEKACRDVEKRREELESYRRELEEKIASLEASLSRNFDDYNEILSVKEELTRIFDGIDGEVRDFLEFTAASLGEVEIERDPEKRRLLARLRELEGDVSALRSELEGEREENSSLRKRLQECSELLEERERTISELRERSSELERSLSELEARAAELESRAQARERELEEAKRRLEERLEGLGRELEELRESCESLSRERAELQKALREAEQRSAELEDKLSRLRREVRESLLEVLERIGS
ncbi:MAG: hypothetical protein GXO66_03985 [Euryarchaeota archaeon]|nr:hypothetical protein [Euryarchaeota archaeon]